MIKEYIGFLAEHVSHVDSSHECVVEFVPFAVEMIATIGDVMPG
jgi:hypothetical protein